MRELLRCRTRVDEADRACYGVSMLRAHYVGFLGLSLLLCGCRVSEPSPLEREVVVAAEHDFTVGNRSQKNPLPLTKETLSSLMSRRELWNGADAQISRWSRRWLPPSAIQRRYLLIVYPD